jgi:hypothetical protein
MLGTLLSSDFRRVRMLSIAIVAATVLPLPLGFVDEEIAVFLVVYGLYLTLPMVCIVGAAALAVHRLRTAWALRSLGIVLLVLTAPYTALWALWIGPFVLPPVAAVFLACRRLFATARAVTG